MIFLCLKMCSWFLFFLFFLSSIIPWEVHYKILLPAKVLPWSRNLYVTEPASIILIAVIGECVKNITLQTQSRIMQCKAAQEEHATRDNVPSSWVCPLGWCLRKCISCLIHFSYNTCMTIDSFQNSRSIHDPSMALSTLSSWGKATSFIFSHVTTT